MRLERILVSGLVRRFDYDIPMNLNDRITIIHGPNGFGKTVLLRLLAGLFSRSNGALVGTPFTEFKLEFENAKFISVKRAEPTKKSQRAKEVPDLHFTFFDGSRSHEFTWHESGREQIEIPFQLIDEVIPELEREDRDMWRHEETGEFFTSQELALRFQHRLPFMAVPDVPDWLKQVRESVKVRFIQAERLQARPRERAPHGSKTPPTRAVKQYSQELGAITKLTLTEYAALSQSLDRTFPARVVSQSSPLSNEELQRALKDIETKRARLVGAGLLEREGDEPTVAVPKQIDETRRAVLSVYVQDTHQKLSVLDNLAAKVELFVNSINQRFQYKRISVSKDGFTLTTPEGEILNPVHLSSGEQHEIVLLYELLFKAPENSLILIDEPEISLHVGWQEQFLSDLRAVASLTQFDILIATHSPQIISTRWDLTVELKGPGHEAAVKATRHSK